MPEIRAKVDELAKLMTEFGLERGRISTDEVSVEFALHPPTQVMPMVSTHDLGPEEPITIPNIPVVPPSLGTPIASPMMGVYYASPSPGSPPFVSEGDSVTAGQVVGLIEAMKVFNEITSPTSGTVSSIAAESGKLVQPGEPLMFIS